MASRGTYRARRVHAELTLGLGLEVDHNQIELLMARADIKDLPGTRRRQPRHETPTATDLVERMFTREAPNRLWVADSPLGPSPTGPNGRDWCPRWGQLAIVMTTR